jgi:hypothetical protein
MDDQELEALATTVRYLRDRSEIFDCVQRHARAHDRHDAELMASCYFDDGVDEHGYAINTGPEYATWANLQHAASSASHLHNITTHLCEIDGDVANCESYVMVVLLSPDQKTTSIMNGRYIDRLERREGQWRIVVRRTTVDAVCTGDASMLSHPFFKQQGYVSGQRDRTDISYQRPIEVDDGEAVVRW